MGREVEGFLAASQEAKLRKNKLEDELHLPKNIVPP